MAVFLAANAGGIVERVEEAGIVFSPESYHARLC